MDMTKVTLLSKSSRKRSWLSIIRLGSTAYSFFTCPFGKYRRRETPVSFRSAARTSGGSLSATPNFPQEINIRSSTYPAIALKQFLNATWWALKSLGWAWCSNFSSVSECFLVIICIFSMRIDAAIQLIKTPRYFTRHFKMRNLIFAHRHDFRTKR